MTSLKNSDTTASYVSLMITILSALILVPIIESSVGKNYYGIYQFILSLTIYSELMTMGLGKTIERYVAKYAEQKVKDMENAVISIALSIYIITSLILLAGVGILYWQFENLFSFSGNELEIARISFLIAALNAGLNVPASLFWFHLRGRGRFALVFNMRTAKAVLRIPVYVLLLQAGHGIATIFLADLIFSQLINLFYASISIKNYQLKIRLFYFDKTLAQKLFQFTAYILLAGIAHLIYWNADNIVLGIFTNAEIIAEYALSQRLMDYFFKYSVAFSGLFLPLYMGCYSNTKRHESINNLAELFTWSSRIMGIIMSFAVVNFIVLGRDFIMLWIGNRYSMTYVYAVIILIPYWLVLSQSTATEMVYVMNKHKTLTFIYLGSALINIAATVYLVQQFGPIGAAAATGASLFLGYFLIANMYYRSLLNIKLSHYFTLVYLKNAFVSGIVLLYGYGLNQLINQVSVFNFMGKGLLLNLLFIPLIYFILLNGTEQSSILQKLDKTKLKIRSSILSHFFNKRKTSSEEGNLQ